MGRGAEGREGRGGVGTKGGEGGSPKIEKEGGDARMRGGGEAGGGVEDGAWEAMITVPAKNAYNTSKYGKYTNLLAPEATKCWHPHQVRCRTIKMVKFRSHF